MDIVTLVYLIAQKMGLHTLILLVLVTAWHVTAIDTGKHKHIKGEWDRHARLHISVRSTMHDLSFIACTLYDLCR